MIRTVHVCVDSCEVDNAKLNQGAPWALAVNKLFDNQSEFVPRGPKDKQTTLAGLQGQASESWSGISDCECHPGRTKEGRSHTGWPVLHMHA